MARCSTCKDEKWLCDECQKPPSSCDHDGMLSQSGCPDCDGPFPDRSAPCPDCGGTRVCGSGNPYDEDPQHPCPTCSPDRSNLTGSGVPARGRPGEPAKERSDKAVSPSNNKLIERPFLVGQIEGALGIIRTGADFNREGLIEIMENAASALEEREGLEADYARFKNEFWVALRPLISETGKVGASTLAHALDLAEEAALNPPPIEKAGCERCGGSGEVKGATPDGSALGPCPNCTSDPAPTQPSGGGEG